MIIRSKIAMPHVTERLVDRPRLAQAVAELIEGDRVVWVTATAGSGKTTAVVQATRLVNRPLAWLTLDDTDTAPGRLLIYLEATLAGQVPEVEGVASRGLTAGLPQVECAGLLAEATEGTPLLLVLDGVEHLARPGADQARALLAAFIRYAPLEMTIVLLSRVEVPLDIGTIAGIDPIASVEEADLAFTPQEAAAALASAGTAGLDPTRVVRATGGWVAGVLFEAWRSREHLPGTGGEADPLHGYLATQILGQLESAEREFLVSTALLDEVTPARAVALGHHDAGERLVALRTKHLPVTWTPRTHHMQCHPRFREYLIARLERRNPSVVRAARRTYGELLVSEGHLEEAVEQFLSAEALDSALAAAELGIGPVIDRLDFSVAERWLRTLEPLDSLRVRRLATAELMVAIGREDYRRGGAVADRLQAEGRREALAQTSPVAASMMVWCYWHLARLDDARTVMAVAPRSPEVDAAGYLMSLAEHAPSSTAPMKPSLYGGPLDALVMRVHYAYGRLRDLSITPASPWASAVLTPWRVGALRATGHLTQALELYRAADASAFAPAWLHGMVGAELMIDLEQIDPARSVLVQGGQLIQASGSVVFGWLNRLIEAKLELRLCRDPGTSLAILEELELGGARRYDFIGEALDTWFGLGLLLLDRDEKAAAHLARAVNSMVAAERVLDLPTAAVYLAEAEWRRGNIEAADEAADQALAAADAQGSNHHLLLALAEFPAVVARRLDAVVEVESSWHALGRAMMARGVSVDLQTGPLVALTEFGRVAVAVDGLDVKPRISKSLTLLAYLASVPDHRATRDDLLVALFDGRSHDSSSAYLRQAAHRLREVLPPGVGPAITGGVLAFTAPVAIISESSRMEALLAEADRLQGEAQLEGLLAALDIFDRGEYLPGVSSAWAVQRRRHLEARAARARMQAAHVAFAAQRYQQAEQLAEAVLVQDPFKESAWRLLMRIGNAVGDDDLVMGGFRRCRAVLHELGVGPSDATQRLFGQLRR